MIFYILDTGGLDRLSLRLGKKLMASRTKPSCKLFDAYSDSGNTLRLYLDGAKSRDIHGIQTGTDKVTGKFVVTANVGQQTYKYFSKEHSFQKAQVFARDGYIDVIETEDMT